MVKIHRPNPVVSVESCCKTTISSLFTFSQFQQRFDQGLDTLYRRPIQILMPNSALVVGAMSFSIGQFRSIHAIPRDLSVTCCLPDAPINSPGKLPFLERLPILARPFHFWKGKIQHVCRIQQPYYIFLLGDFISRL